MAEQRELVRFLDEGEVAGEEFSPREEEVLSTVNRRVAAAESLEDVMGFLFEQTRDISPCDRIGLAFVEEEGRRIAAHWARALYAPLVLKKGYTEDVQGGTLAELLDTGRLRIINDLERYLSENPESGSTRLLVKEGVRSSMTCPLRVDDRVVGVMFRSSREPYAYDEHEARLHFEVSERLSQAVEKTFRIEQLAAANRSYFEMLGFVSHELKSPLASLMTEGYALAEGYRGALAPEHKAVVERMVRKADYLLGMVRDYLNLARIESDTLEMNAREGVDLMADVAAPAAELVATDIEEKEIAFQVKAPDEPVKLYCDPQLLTIVLTNLLSNAVKYADPGGQVRLSVSNEGPSVRAAVWNTGPGFPPEERQRLFRKFSRLQTRELLQRKGTGVGLYTCWRIVKLHNGNIDARSEPGEWAEFFFDVPSAAANKTVAP